MAEEDRGIWGVFSRQLFRTHRAFRSVIMDREGRPVLWIHRPFSWINSRIYVQRKIEEDVVVLGEAQQEWHLWRRRYNVFTGREGDFEQFARVDAPFLSWEFYLQDANDDNVASIQKNFAGFGREIFTDTGQYALTFRPHQTAPSALASPEKQTLYRRLTLEERATVLALSVGIDFDYFSRHSEGGGGLPFFFWWNSGD
ncbi:hypothetical protein BS47DRAFT_1338767 [Hydnum rufescens UP504]|uniref:Phospholipid scramblase n=1 Tax=Hydnum rufescens UP504 TaxID=1448309 RepID=A0A9P6B5A8_9AGAM|nr:hypothetical protein BS47DRAFT_1338767 [Hydnum rufescens UP504]